MKAGFFIKTIAVTAVALTLLYLGGIYARQYKEESSFKKFAATVSYVVDGDTVKLSDGRTVRLLGIDTPETNHPDQPVQRFGAEAKKYLKDAVEGRECTFEYDVRNEKDVYGRLLCIIYLGEENVNASLVKQGLAYVYIKDPSSRTKDFPVLENIAKKFRRGIWQYGVAGQAKL